jgi:hypothetical protein
MAAWKEGIFPLKLWQLTIKVLQLPIFSIPRLELFAASLLVDVGSLDELLWVCVVLGFTGDFGLLNVSGLKGSLVDGNEDLVSFCCAMTE